MNSGCTGAPGMSGCAAFLALPGESNAFSWRGDQSAAEHATVEPPRRGGSLAVAARASGGAGSAGAATLATGFGAARGVSGAAAMVSAGAGAGGVAAGGNDGADDQTSARAASHALHGITPFGTSALR